MTSFSRRGEVIFAELGPAEATVIRQVMAGLATLLSPHADPDDPAVERLLPDVYPEDPRAEAEFRRLTEGDLRSGKLASVTAILAELPDASGRTRPHEVRLDAAGADLWLRALTDARLALGTRIGITDDTDVEAELDAAVGRSPSSQRVSQLSVYAYLSYLQQSLVMAVVGH